ncbi:MAG TPA: radical SAM protein, partial [Myxococcota bacterium]|nr:radical SAM protein [Myxococcota bacterium]
MSLPPLATPRPTRALGADDLAAPRPVYVVWELTLRCDLSCHHCGSRAGKARADELTTAEALDVVRQLAALGTREISLIGGEAYLRADFLAVVRAIRAAGIVCAVTTGGRAIDDALAAAMAAAGVQQASVSVDGLAPTHDRLRGVRGSHDSALASMRACAGAGIRVSANTQIGALNRRELPAVLDELVAAGARSWQVQLTAALGRAADNPDLLLQPFDLLELFPVLLALKHRAAAAGVWLMPANNVGYFGPYEDDLRATPWGESAHWQGCLAGRASLGLESDGTVKACPSLQTDAYAGGNVRDTPLRELWERSPRLGFTRARGTEDLWGFCAGCYYADVCQGGCSYTAHALFGRRGNNPYC